VEEVSRIGSDPRQVVERYLSEILNRKSLVAADELIGNETLKQRVSAFIAAFPDLEVAHQHLIGEGEIVAVHLSARATHQGPFQGMPPTGKRWTATCSALYQVKAGVISEAWVNWDLLAIMEQIGAVRRTEGASA
jgi:predicted ester cyclase